MRFFLLTLFIAMTVSAQAGYNFGVVVENKTHQIYRTAALGAKGLSYVKGHLRKRGLPFPKTIIYMNKAGFKFDKEERGLQGKYGYKYHHIYLDGHWPNKERFFQVMKMVLDEKNQPVLFHCLGGRHRTGMIAMAIRYLQEGEWTEGPWRRRYVFPRIRTPWLRPAENEYVNYNAALFRMTNVNFVRSVSKTEPFIELKEAYQDLLNM